MLRKESQMLPGPGHLLPALPLLRVTGRRALGLLPPNAWGTGLIGSTRGPPHLCLSPSGAGVHSIITPCCCWKVQGLLEAMSLDTTNKIHRITKEAKFVEIESSKYF